MNQTAEVHTPFGIVEGGAAPLPAVLDPPNSLPATLLEKAITSGASLEVIGKLMDYQDRWDATVARKAFNVAFVRAKGKFPIVKKNRSVGFESKRTSERTDYAYEDLASIDRAVRDPLREEGLAYRFITVNDEKWVTVTCILAHELGHEERNTLRGPVDPSGLKNPLQAISSAQTYLERYTVKAALGLATEEDDDGREAGNRKEDRPKPPSSKPDAKVSYTIPFAGVSPVDWAWSYKKGLTGAKSKKELAQWAYDNAVALAALGKLEKSEDPEIRACAYLIDEIDQFYRERLDLLDGKEKAAPPPHDPETGEIIEPEPPSGSAPAQSRARPPSSKPKDPVQEIMALKDASEVFQWMQKHPTMTRAEVDAMAQRKKELGIT